MHYFLILFLPLFKLGRFLGNLTLLLFMPNYRALMQEEASLNHRKAGEVAYVWWSVSQSVQYQAHHIPLELLGRMLWAAIPTVLLGGWIAVSEDWGKTSLEWVTWSVGIVVVEWLYTVLTLGRPGKIRAVLSDFRKEAEILRAKQLDPTKIFYEKL